MSEQIGKVIINDSRYPGEDLYSEGANEDRLLQLVTEHGEEEFGQVILSQWSWPVLYHLSHIRGNIVQWLPIGKTDRVLEIGSGCGAVTGVLAEKAGHVTCIELSRKRSLINAQRNQRRSNIEILLGNFEDVEQDLTEAYDYIMLIGVFEYAACYIHSQDPYRDFLRAVASHLAPGGKIVIAIENKYGLKYWAGCKEDHTGRFYDSIEGYPGVTDVRTFSRRELLAFAKDCGLKAQVYYPYPDYKFPHAVYSDDYLPKRGELNNNLRNFDGDRVVAFDETKAFDELLLEGEFPFFSNSYELILTKEEIAETRTVYTKFSNERSVAASIRTDIMQRPDGSRYVRKSPMTADARAHVTCTYGWYELLKEPYAKNDWQPNVCRLDADGRSIALDYIDGVTLEEKLINLRSAGGEDEVRGHIREFAAALLRLADGGAFRLTEQFKRVFGAAALSEGHVTARVTNLDMIFSNMLMDEHGIHIIDYEWTFLFPIPVKFIIYRAVWYFLEDSGMQEKGIYEELGISEADREAFAAMEHSFQRFIISGQVSLTTAHALMSGLTLPLEKLVEQGSYFRDLHVIKVYYDFGEGMSERTLHLIRGDVAEDELVSVTVPVAEGAKRVRIDPTEYPCMVKLHSFCCDGAPVERFLANASFLTPEFMLFDTDDAQIILWEVPAGAKELTISYTVSMLRNDLFKEAISVLEDMQSEIHMLRSRPEPPTAKEIVLSRLGLLWLIKKEESAPEPVTEPEDIDPWEIIPYYLHWNRNEEPEMGESEEHES